MTTVGYRFFTGLMQDPGKYLQLEIVAMSSITPVNAVPAQPSAQERALREAAEKMEAGFLAEMLKSAGLGKTGGQFGGGAGEDQFSSFLVQEQAMQMVKAGGIGLAETLFESLKEKTHDHPSK
jgi:peptidoglycan hydrolase FlgJ